MRTPASDFPLLLAHPELTYLDSAATTQKPQAVLDALRDYYGRHNANVHRAAHRLAAEATQAFENARLTVARFINAKSPASIVWTRGTTEAINLVAHSWGRRFLQPGDVILLSELEHHANIVPWQLLSQERGCELRVLPVTDAGELLVDDRYFDERVKLLAVTGLSNALGTLTPLTELIARAHGVGAKVLVDAAQLIAHAAVDVQQLDCDFLVFSGHKLYGPTGIGVLYGKDELLEQMPPWQAGGEMIERVSFSGSTFLPPPLRFEAGTPNIAGVIGLAAAIDYLNRQDLTAQRAHEAALLAQLEAGIDALPGLIRISRAPQRAALVSFCATALHASDLAALLDGHGIAVRAGHHCAMPLMARLQLTATVRASLGLYSREADIDKLLMALAQILTPTGKAAAPTAQPIDAWARLQSARGWEARYRTLMLLGKELPALSEPERAAATLVPGCEAKVWFAVAEDHERLWFRLDSEARIVRGLLALLLAIYNGKTRTEIAVIDIDAIFAELDLHKHLSPSRSNGLLSVVKAIQNS